MGATIGSGLIGSSNAEQVFCGMSWNPSVWHVLLGSWGAQQTKRGGKREDEMSFLP